MSIQKGFFAPIATFLVLIVGLGYFVIKSEIDRALSTTASTAENKKILLLIYNPILKSQAGQKLTAYRKWNDPDVLTNNVIGILNSASGGRINYTVAERIELDDYPVKPGGFKFTDEEFLACPVGPNCSSIADYVQMINSVDACGKRNSGAIDELWVWGGPWFGFWESNLAGPGAYWYNSTPTSGTSCQKLLPIMGLNYERGEPEALESYGHRVESTLIKIYGSWRADESNSWNKFSLLDKDKPGRGGCGNAHCGVNATDCGYDRTNTRTVPSSCDDFLNYPALTSTFKDTNCNAWGCTTLGYFQWWYSHMPKADGVGSDGKLSNWWLYIVNPEYANSLPVSLQLISSHSPSPSLTSSPTISPVSSATPLLVVTLVQESPTASSTNTPIQVEESVSVSRSSGGGGGGGSGGGGGGGDGGSGGGGGAPAPATFVPGNNVPRVVTGSLPKGKLNKNYSTNIISSDKDGKDVIGVTAVNLPPGINLGSCFSYAIFKTRYSRCRLSGKPTQKGDFSVVVSVRDSRGAVSQRIMKIKI